MKTATQLGISEEVRDGLIWVKNKLENNFFAHISHLDSNMEFPNERNAFNMGLTHKTYECGSVACIGGWVWTAMNLDEVIMDGDLVRMDDRQTSLADAFVYHADSVDEKGDGDGRLRRLFFPPHHLSYDRITTKEAAQAIGEFLETGKTNWEKILERGRDNPSQL